MPILNLMKICPAVVEFNHADGHGLHVAEEKINGDMLTHIEWIIKCLIVNMQNRPINNFLYI